LGLVIDQPPIFCWRRWSFLVMYRACSYPA
jgi:hypothetical protein